MNMTKAVLLILQVFWSKRMKTIEEQLAAMREFRQVLQGVRSLIFYDDIVMLKYVNEISLLLNEDVENFKDFCG